MDEDIEKIDEQIQSMMEKPEEEAAVFEEISNTKTVETVEDLKEEAKEEAEEVLEEEPEPVVETPPVETKEDVPTPAPAPKKKSHLVIWILVAGIVILCLIFIAVLVVTRTPKKEQTDKKKELTAAEQKQIIEEYGEALEGIIGVYYQKQDVLLEYEDAILLVKYDHEVVCDEHEIYEDGKVFLDECSIDEQEVAYSYGKKQKKAELQEGAIKVYVSKSSGKATLKEPSNVKEYDVYSFDIAGKYANLMLLSEKSDYVFYNDANRNPYMYNYKTRKKALPELEYQEILPFYYQDEADTKYAAVKINNLWGVYNLENESRVVPPSYVFYYPYSSDHTGIFGFKAIGDGLIPVIKYDNYNYYGVLNYKTNQLLIPCELRQMGISEQYIWGIDDHNDSHIYDISGTELFFNQYDKVYYMVDGKYILVNDDQHIKLITPSGKELYDYGEREIGKFNYGFVYKSGSIFSFINPNVENEQLDKSCYEFIYEADTKTGEVKEAYCGGVAKPILYLYPKKTTKVTVSFDHPEFLETTYPKYIDRWEVTAKKNGDLIDADGKSYYALYWDEVKVHPVDFSTGFYVTKEDAISFLEEKLTYIGLNDRERNEFIMYWLPILEKNGQSLVYFELTEERESYSKIHITPEPDSLLRLVIHIKKVDHKVNIKEEKLTRFNRKGFTAVEWGGTMY